MNNLEKIISLFESIKLELHNNKREINKEIDYEKIEIFINEFDNDIFSLLKIVEFKNVLNLNNDEEKELFGLIKILNAFKDNDALILTKDMENEIRNKKTITIILEKFQSIIKEYKNYLEEQKNYEQEMIRLNSIIDSLKNKSSIDYIENIDEIYEYLYNKNNIDLKVKFEIYKLVGEYNIIVGKNKFDMFTKGEEPVIDNKTKDEKEEIVVQTKPDLESLKNVFAKYNYSIEKIDGEIIKVLLNANINNIEDVLLFFDNIGLRFNESLKSSIKYLMIIARSDKEVLNNLKNICEKQGIELLDLLKKCPTTAMRKLKTTNKLNVTKNEYLLYYSGSYEDFLANINTLKELGYQINKAMKECISIFAYPNKSLLENIRALEIYGINVKDSKGIFKLSGLKNKDVLFTIDQFIELDELSYVTYNTSRFALLSDDAIFYRLYKIKKYNLEHPLEPIEYRRYKEKGYDFSSIITQDNKGNDIVSRFSDKHKATNTIIPTVFDEETTQRLKSLINEKKTYFSKKSKNMDLVKYLDLRFKSPQSESTYIIGGKVFSRIKVMRLLSILENENIEKNDLMVFCITYNSIISEDEFERVENAIYGLERGRNNE